MAKEEICRKISDGRTLVYYIIDNGDGASRYGAEIDILENGTSCVIAKMSNDRERVMRLIDMFATMFVAPNMMGKIAFEWLAEI